MSFHGASLIQLPDIKAWDPISGWSIRRPWRGTPTQVANQATLLKSLGIRFELEPGGESGHDTVFGIFGAEDGQAPTEELTNSWDLVGNDLEKDIWWHPKVTAMFNQLLDPPGHPDGVPTDLYIVQRKRIDDIVAGATLISEHQQWWDDLFPDAKKFVRALLRGVTAYSVSQFVLRNTVVVASNYSIKPAYTNVGKILTTAQVQTIHNPPTTIKFALPEGFWLERTPTCEQTASDKFTITREWYHHDEYDDFLYDPA